MSYRVGDGFWSRTELTQDNVEVDYVDAETGAYRFTDSFRDPYLKQLKDGTWWYGYGCGRRKA